ncbi:YqeG family HAD IIIA-type phosphatase [Paludicola sp. MB14-C6]|uniref:YqeG family HAD IIIA-type phosphatase n=1 Tax=Paludihabitans sp. MB14-C6 TaxID=3070656 RepID=UPI0027DE7D7A|nr:YqeG family HAD IIIA-type phosphatase [Paludicola sp. MB14-C6]WMJ23673.1 YqeG family HAD IIIA-type phosphatase [Paludicola sp. MB14-C6]
MSVFIPNLILPDVTSIDIPLLNQYNIKGIILDVDNTLTTHGSQEIKAHISDWLDVMKGNNIKLIIVSNNTFERIEPFANNLKLDFVAMGCKPLTSGFTKAQKKLGLPRNEIAVVGDQIYTDIVGGNLKRFFTILVTPFELEDGKFFKLKRMLESRHIKRYNKRKSKENAC